MVSNLREYLIQNNRKTIVRWFVRTGCVAYWTARVSLQRRSGCKQDRRGGGIWQICVGGYDPKQHGKVCRSDQQCVAGVCRLGQNALLDPIRLGGGGGAHWARGHYVHESRFVRENKCVPPRGYPVDPTQAQRAGKAVDPRQAQCAAEQGARQHAAFQGPKFPRVFAGA